jgi:hypothetical protein
LRALVWPSTMCERGRMVLATMPSTNVCRGSITFMGS